MGIPVEFFVLFGYSFGPEDISFGEGNTLEVPINGGEAGTIDNVQLVKRQLTLSLKGATEADVTSLEATRANNVLALLNKNLETTNIEIGGYSIEKAYINKVTPSGPQKVNGTTLFNSVEIIVSSRVYS